MTSISAGATESMQQTLTTVIEQSLVALKDLRECTDRDLGPSRDAQEMEERYMKLRRQVEEMTTKCTSSDLSLTNLEALEALVGVDALDDQKENSNPVENDSNEKKVAGTTTVAKEAPSKNDEVSSSEGAQYFSPLNDDEFANIPRYMLGSTRLNDLNAILLTLNSVITKRLELRQQKISRLQKHDKDLVAEWKAQECDLKLDASIPFCSETELKNALDTRLKGTVFKAMPCLRHVQRLREMRHKKKIYYVAFT
jgi:hypothetical protein